MEHSVGPCTMRLTRCNSEGSVRLEWKVGDGNFCSMDIDAETWASLVCNVSVHGEESGRWYQAGVFHNGGQPVTNETV